MLVYATSIHILVLILRTHTYAVSSGKSDLTDKMKRRFFQAAIVSILLYGCTTWTLTKWLEKKLDGNYTRIWFGLVWFYGISTFLGYLTPNPFYVNNQFYLKQFGLA